MGESVGKHGKRKLERKDQQKNRRQSFREKYLSQIIFEITGSVPPGKGAYSSDNVLQSESVDEEKDCRIQANSSILR